MAGNIAFLHSEQKPQEQVQGFVGQHVEQSTKAAEGIDLRLGS